MKRKIRNVLIAVFVTLTLLFIFEEDRYIISNLKVIDRVDTILIANGENDKTYDFNDDWIDYLSYGGSIIEIDNVIENIFIPYKRKLDKTEVSISYFIEGEKRKSAEIYYDSENEDSYILYMNHVYWKTGKSFSKLLEKIQ